jgi:hypothetical protein
VPGLDAPEAGYSGTPLWKKLGCKAGGKLLLVGPPAGFALPEAPEDLHVAELEDHGAAGDASEVLVAFFGALGELAAALPGLSERIFPDAALWVAWPRAAPRGTRATSVSRTSATSRCRSASST